MRVYVRVIFPVESGNAVMRSGTPAPTTNATLKEMQPEIAFY
jgi:hypothetical protein